MARTNNRNNNWTGSNNSAYRCSELVGYPPNFKKNTGANRGSASNNVVTRNRDQSNTFTDDQYKRLMSLISEKSGSSSIPANIADSGASQHMTYTIINMLNIVDVSKLNMTVGHPNDSVLKSQVGIGNESNGLLGHPSDQVLDILKHKLNLETNSKTDICEVQSREGYKYFLTVVDDYTRTPSSVLSRKSPYEMIFKNEPNLSHLKVFGCLCFSTVLNNNDKFSSRDVKFYETVFPFKNTSENKDYELEINNLNGLNFFNCDLEEDLSSEPNDDKRDSNGASDDGKSEEEACDNLESAILEDNNSVSEGDDTAYQEFNNQFQSPVHVENPDNQKKKHVITWKGKKLIMHAPLQSHLKIAFRVLRYLTNSPGKGISFVKSNDLNLSVFVDSDCKKQSMLAKSSAEAEYKAMNTVTCEVIWIHKILTELNVQISLPVPIHCDNSFAIQIAANPVFHEKTKHFEIELLFLREKVSAGVVKTLKVKSVDNVVKSSREERNVEKSNIGDSDNTRDGGKIVSGAIGACGGIDERASEAKRSSVKSSEKLGEVFPNEAGK
ncbi:ribonuclease H-like domain-containing protein [Tanacetum coccineum]